jgi:hypothetical protein
MKSYAITALLSFVGVFALNENTYQKPVTAAWGALGAMCMALLIHRFAAAMLETRP